MLHVIIFSEMEGLIIFTTQVLQFAFKYNTRKRKSALPLPCIILNANRRTKNGGGLGTRLLNRLAPNFLLFGSCSIQAEA